MIDDLEASLALLYPTSCRGSVKANKSNGQFKSHDQLMLRDGLHAEDPVWASSVLHLPPCETLREALRNVQAFPLPAAPNATNSKGPVNPLSVPLCILSAATLLLSSLSHRPFVRPAHDVCNYTPGKSWIKHGHDAPPRYRNQKNAHY